MVIKNLDEDLAARLHIEAAQQGCFPEEVLCILRHALTRQPLKGLGSRISERFASVGGVGLDLPARRQAPHQTDFCTVHASLITDAQPLK